MIMRGDISKWKNASRHFGSWNTKKQRKVQELEAEVILGWILELKLPRYDILEIGCGNGHVGECIAQGLLDCGIDFSYCFSDLLPESVEQTRANLVNFSEPSRLSFRVLDIFEAETALGKGSQHVIISTGFVSAATQRHAIPIVASILCDGGVLIADFINHFSLGVFFSHPIRSVVQIYRYVKKTGKSYHLGRLGIRGVFGAQGLTLLRSTAVRFRRNPIVCLFKKQG